MLDQIIEHLGEGIELKNVTRVGFRHLHLGLYQQHLLCVGDPACEREKNIAPEHGLEAYADYLQEAIDNVLG